MTYLLETLSKNPAIGYVSSLSASAISFIDNIMPWCQILGVVLGLLVAALTIIAKSLEVKKLRKSNKTKNDGIS